MFSPKHVLLLILGLCFAQSGIAQVLGDPTAPSGTFAASVLNDQGEPVLAQRPKPRWLLSSTLISEERSIAVINGQSVALGASIEGAKLLAVDQRSALINDRGRQIRLKMPASAGTAVTAKTPSGR